MKILFSCEDFSEKSFASLINRARARRRARAREAIKPYLFSLWMVGITAKRTAIHRMRRGQESEAPAEPPLNGLKPGSPGAARLSSPKSSPYPSPGEEMSHEAPLRKTGGRQSRPNEADTQTRSSRCRRASSTSTTTSTSTRTIWLRLSRAASFCADPSFLRWSEIWHRRSQRSRRRPGRNEKILGQHSRLPLSTKKNAG